MGEKTLTTKQTWVLSTIALAEGLNKYQLEGLWAHTLYPGRPPQKRVFRLSDHDSFNMRKTLDSLMDSKLIKEIEKDGVTFYHIISWDPHVYSAGQSYRPYTRKVMTHLSNKYLGDKKK